MKIVFAVGFACLSLGAVAGPLEDLLPRPKRCAAGGGTVVASGIGNPRIVRGKPSGVPSGREAECYRLDVTASGAVITAPDARGVRLAKVTLDQLAKLSGGEVPCCTIEDWPTFPWRGLMHDCGRNFLDVGSIRRILDLMAAYKLNLFHWHLTDYYGWRLESRKHPMLQAPWAYGRQQGCFYTQREFREILSYARGLGITVMPELDVPGHTLAFRKGLGLERMADERARDIVADLIDELCSLATAEEMPFVHLGTDEARRPCEQVPDSYCPFWAARICANGRRPVGWAPGKLTSSGNGKIVRMLWNQNAAIASGETAFDATRCYFGRYDPFDFLKTAVFSKPCRWTAPDESKLGLIICSWHDDAAGDGGRRVLTDNHFAPAIVTLCDSQWNGRAEDRPQYLVHLPPVGSAAFDEAVRFEKAVAAQRDRVLGETGLPFAWVRQTQMRWRISDGDGTVVAEDVPQATVFIHKFDSRDPGSATNSFIRARTGTAVLETWIRSPSNQTVGAWIGFGNCARSNGRRHGIPEIGEWAISKGVRVEVNGRRIEPPKWTNAGLKYVAEHPEEPTSNNIAETPFTDEAFWMRPPAPLELKEGWNAVRLTVPKTFDKWRYDWAATFVPVLGSSAHPREVPDLEYRSSPPF